MKTLVLGILLSSLYVVANAQNRTNTYKKDVLIWYKAFNENAPALLDGILDKNWEDIPAALGAPTGPEGVKRMLVELITTFPDFKVQVCFCQLDLAPFDALIWPHLVLFPPARHQLRSPAGA